MEGGGGNTASLYEVLFDLQTSICERFHISPFQVRRERFSEFCLLVKRLKKQNDEADNKPKTTVTKGGKQKFIIPVTDYKKPQRRG